MAKRRFSILFVVTTCSLFLICSAQDKQTFFKPKGYVQTFGLNNKVATLWLYDTQGRVIIDSLRPLDSLTTSLYSTVHYRYNKDSIIGLDSSGQEIVILLNPAGSPIFTYDPDNRMLYAIYNADGTLNRIDEMRDEIIGYIDNVVYLNGNIVSYRLTNGGDFNFVTVSFTYYEDKDASSLYSQLKPFALRSDRVFGSLIDVQALSINLLKSVSYAYEGEEASRTTSFAYKFDDKGKATEMERVLRQRGEPQKSKYEFIYETK